MVVVKEGGVSCRETVWFPERRVRMAKGGGRRETRRLARIEEGGQSHSRWKDRTARSTSFPSSDLN
jgi:hypothetical protein